MEKTANESVLSSAWLAIRSVLWALLLPGVVAGFVPWKYFGVGAVQVDPSRPAHLAGVLLVGVGTVLLALCIWEFARSGRGTLAPMDAPQRLVVQGLYRYVRNPMYLAVTTILIGEVLLTGSTALLLYWLVWFTIVNLFVIGYEEPNLRRRFGESFERYSREVGRWLPRVPGRRDS